MSEIAPVEATPILPIPLEARIPGADERTITLDGIRWRYLQAGSGPPLLLIHGLMGYSFSWRFCMNTLARNFTVYAVDLPGCGFSERSDRLEGSLTSDAEGLLKFIEALGLADVYVLGTSRGGGLSITLAKLAAKRGQPNIRKLILSAPINPWSKFGQLRAKLLATYFGGLYAVHVIPRMPKLLKSYFVRLYGDPKHIPSGSFHGYQAGLEPAGSFQHLSRMMQPWSADLKRIGATLNDISELPILLLWGERDVAVLPGSAYELEKRLRNSTVLMMKGIGHMPYEEVPDAFSRIAVDFFLHDQPATPLQITPETNAAQAAVITGTDAVAAQPG